MTIPPITEIEAVETLDKLARAYERAAELTPRFAERYNRNATAIRWALSLTAFPLDEAAPR